MTQAEAQAYNAGVRDTLALARFLADDLVQPSPIAAVSSEKSSWPGGKGSTRWRTKGERC